ncbi:unnamed protein product [Clavelina lepadiformis]|uniref:Uncharacterized protein n=1 Tax=Clavelina lepadiformis TaxID=159417 RepID=A0ABP0GRW6_CLALP
MSKQPGAKKRLHGTLVNFTIAVYELTTAPQSAQTAVKIVEKHITPNMDCCGAVSCKFFDRV